MKENLKILYIARNIPIPGIKENDIILRISRAVEQYGKAKIDIWFPKEFLLDLPFIKGRMKAIAKLSPSFYYDEKKIFSINYLRLLSVRLSYLFMFSIWVFNKKLFRKVNEYNLIHAHNIMPDGFIALKLKEKYKIPLVVTMRNGDLDKIHKLSINSFLYRKYLQILHGADEIILHNYATEEFIKSHNLSYLKIPHGIENVIVEKFERKNTKRIICVSQLIRRKNVNWLIEAFKLINKSDWQLIIVGEGYLENKLKSISQNFKNITFLGKLSRNRTLHEMKKSDIFVLPSDDETFGLVYLEAAVTSCAIIAKKFTGIYGWMKEDLEAIFISNIEELSTSLKNLIENEELRFKIAKNGHTKVTNEMIWDDQIKKYSKVYEQICS
ncbi:MAG: glycosyltransferase family 4 protein [Melioribacteraceae bacterium]|nr:glycosyltransferase family 4 protein [Melioribacteraceae bacterium]MCF8354537.1 glycosyltransferase family 4 protein [Melioribacteraceae bacterium]MCF8393833.1 glycosyltransferase family 4 protein [Melioribacteraceae bacterium]MCF8418206.1 glycosyltransferase family 4 protein [Melioribacteraceae bacterium]